MDKRSIKKEFFLHVKVGLRVYIVLANKKQFSNFFLHSLVGEAGWQSERIGVVEAI